MNTQDIVNTVENILKREQIKFTATGGTRTKRDKWDCYAWRVRFTANVPEHYHGGTEHLPHYETDYYCGLGHVTKPKKSYIKPQPVAPTASNVLHSLIMDSRAADMSFAEWCGEFGYDSDSIKAFDIYRACCESASELRKLLSNTTIAELSAALEDY